MAKKPNLTANTVKYGATVLGFAALFVATPAHAADNSGWVDSNAATATTAASGSGSSFGNDAGSGSTYVNENVAVITPTWVDANATTGPNAGSGSGYIDENGNVSNPAMQEWDNALVPGAVTSGSGSDYVPTDYTEGKTVVAQGQTVTGSGSSYVDANTNQGPETGSGTAVVDSNGNVIAGEGQAWVNAPVTAKGTPETAQKPSLTVTVGDWADENIISAEDGSGTAVVDSNGNVIAGEGQAWVNPVVTAKGTPETAQKPSLTVTVGDWADENIISAEDGSGTAVVDSNGKAIAGEGREWVNPIITAVPTNPPVAEKPTLTVTVGEWADENIVSAEDGSGTAVVDSNGKAIAGEGREWVNPIVTSVPTTAPVESVKPVGEIKDEAVITTVPTTAPVESVKPVLTISGSGSEWVDSNVTSGPETATIVSATDSKGNVTGHGQEWVNSTDKAVPTPAPLKATPAPVENTPAPAKKTEGAAAPVKTEGAAAPAATSGAEKLAAAIKDGKTVNTEAASKSELAYTGTSAAGVAGFGGLILAAGAGLVAAVRRRRAS